MTNCDRHDSSAQCLIVGGGLTGLVIANVLNNQGIPSIVLDKGRGIGGRLATRRFRQGDQVTGVFDFGAQYFSVKEPKFQTWVNQWLEQRVIRQWCQGFGTVDGKPRYCGVRGTRGIAQYLVENLPPGSVHRGTRVTKLNYDQQWQVETEDQQQYQAATLVLTPPVPQSLALLEQSKLEIPSTTQASLKQIEYHPCIALLALLAQPSQIPAPGGVALSEGNLVWLADNQQKGISPQGHSVTLHATPQFSSECWQAIDAEIAQQLLAEAEPWLGSPVTQYQIHRWRYSLPKTLYHQPCLALAELPLVFAGDAFVAPKLEGAVLSGMAAAEAIVNLL